MNNKTYRAKDHEEWLRLRKGGIGSSEIATIVGLNPWETPFQLWRRKKGLDPEKEETFAMRAGHYLEDAVSKFFSDETGLEIIKSSADEFVIVDAFRPYLRVSPDRTYWLKGLPKNAQNKGILECKTTQMSIDPDDLPKHWFCQLQYQLGVARLESGSLAWLSSGREFGYKHLAFVEDFYRWLVDEADKFYQDCIVGSQVPDAVNAKDVLLKYDRHVEGKSVEATLDIINNVHELKVIKDEIAKLEARRDELESDIKMAFGDAEKLTWEGDTIATWKAPKQSMKFDSKTFCKEHPEMSKQYMKPYLGSRRFLLK